MRRNTTSLLTLFTPKKTIYNKRLFHKTCVGYSETRLENARNLLTKIANGIPLDENDKQNIRDHAKKHRNNKLYDIKHQMVKTADNKCYELKCEIETYVTRGYSLKSSLQLLVDYHAAKEKLKIIEDLNIDDIKFPDFPEENSSS